MDKAQKQTEMSAAGWGHIEMAPTAIMNVPYHNFRVSVYQRSVTATQDDGNQFYYTPLLLLQPETAKSVSNPFTQKYQVTFEVTMWNAALEEYLQIVLSKRTNLEIPITSIRPLPVEQIRLEAHEHSPLYTVDSNWQSNAMNSNVVTFRVNCGNKVACAELAENIMEYPDLFASNFTVHYSMEAQKVGRRVITITAKHARRADLVTKLDQKFPNCGNVYMKADDAKNLTLEITTHVLATEIMDGDFVNNDQSLNVMNLIKSALDLTNVGTENFSSEMWESTFWHDDNARPDKISHTLNEIYDKSDSETKVLMEREMAESAKQHDKESSFSESDIHRSGKNARSAQSDRSNESHSDQANEQSSKYNFGASGKGWGVKVNVNASGESASKSSLSTGSKSHANFANANASESEFSSHNASAQSSDRLSESAKSSRNKDDRLDSLLKEAKSLAQWDGTVQIQITHTTATLSSKINVLPTKVVKPSVAPEQTAGIRYLDEIISRSTKIHAGTPDIYQASLTQTGVNHTHKLRRYTVGSKPASATTPKVILVLDATGAGKTTLINGLLNYMFGVKWEDGARLKVIVEEGEATNQAKSMTKFVSAYESYKQYDSPSPYCLTIIDTPGFGDTDGMSRDREITAQLKEMFSLNNQNSGGIDHVDAICIVVQSALARLTATQKYIFDCILSIFGKDIEKNIFLLCTFADDKEPPVLAAVKEAKLPFCKWFPFNNSALYADNGPQSGMFSKLYWEMGLTSIMEFFKYLSQVESRSLTLTREVLKEREALEAAISGLQPQINMGLAKMEEIRQSQIQIAAHEKQLQANVNFIMDIDEPYATRIALAVGEFVTNCLKCNRTCHYPCGIPNNADKAGCAAMENGNCYVCPQRCHWSMHCNDQYRFDYGTKKVRRTLEDVKRVYEQARGEKMSAETLLSRMQDHLDSVGQNVMELIFVCNESLNRLDEIALRPSMMTTTEYVEILIESEKSEKRPGYSQRIKALEEAKERAILIERARSADIMKDGKRKPIKDSRKWISDFFSRGVFSAKKISHQGTEGKSWLKGVFF
ncbi:uncharacterized protein LOC129595064 [Paramacrobiotus metropolitanus]|uniref:uncharacterized protein LOC129595064 n=1 Tax=Paramacrobiotus metropolitanus TaxID=2943436 RepID=UPI002445C26A|nr:uncharacterized protein LOC129595064 [Paramacrobiotus metropolitanus]